MKLVWMISLLLLVQHGHVPKDFTVTEQGEVIATVKHDDFSLSIPGLELIDIYKYSLLMQQIDEQIHKAPINAKLDKLGRIIPEQPGFHLNKSTFTEQFYQYYYNNGPEKIAAPKTFIYPKVDSELLSMIRTQAIGHYVTFFNSAKKSRATNIALAAEAINNHVVFPGETFSFNEVVGKRTEARGYMKAPEIVKGELIEGIGGGICQVSSTLFNAVDRSGVKIIQRYSHSKHVPYVPPGRDATVSWYGPDFTFQNVYNQPLLIRTQVANGKVVVIIYSSDDINVERRFVPSITDYSPRS